MEPIGGLNISLQVGDIRQDSASLALDLTDGSIYSFTPHNSLSDFQLESDMETQFRAFQGKKSAAPDQVKGF